MKPLLNIRTFYEDTVDSYMLSQYSQSAHFHFTIFCMSMFIINYINLNL